MLTGEDLTRFAEDPVGFVKYMEPDTLLTSDQILIMESVRDNRQTSIAAAHGVGKTGVAYIHNDQGKTRNDF